MSEAGSGIEGLRPDSGFARMVAAGLRSENFKLIDVGCAGGLPSGWRAFGDRLSAIAFDANTAEVERLAAAETNPLVRYEAGFVGMPDGHPLKTRIGVKAYWHLWVDHRLAYDRTYSARAARAAGQPVPDIETYFTGTVLASDWWPFPVHGFDTDYDRTFEVFTVSDEEAAAAIADKTPGRTIHLPAYIKGAGFDDADFLKIDIDGPDYEVLRSTTSLLDRPTLLGVSLEVSFFGSHDANDNSFHNMDRLMREKGFDLFGLSVRTYGSAAMSPPYWDAHPSMTDGGRPIQGDALYVRDLAGRHRRTEAAALSDEKLAKAAAILALFTLPDWAAEMLIVHRERLSRVIDVDAGLDALAAEGQPHAENKLSFRDYAAAFANDDPSFFDRYTQRNQWMSGLMRLPAELSAAEAEADRLRSELDSARAAATRAEQAERRAAEAEARVRGLEASVSWRLTRPLRALSGRLRRR